MSRLPRASLCITLLDDEDYRVLMASKGGLEAFGFFAAMLVVGRERLQQGKARQLSDVGVGHSSDANLLHSSVSNSLIFDNSPTHILAMAHVSSKQMERCLNVFKEVAEATGAEPWIYLDKSKHLVIRSFFKFNTSSGWGGERPGAGRKSRRNQDDSEDNQDDTEPKSSRIPSGTGTGPGTGAGTGTGALTAGANGCHDPSPSGSHQECVELALELFPEKVQIANAVSHSKADLTQKLEGPDGRPWWDAFAAGLRLADRMRRRKNATPVDSVVGLALSKAQEWIVLGEIPPDPVGAEAIPADPAPDTSPALSKTERNRAEQRAAIRRLAESDVFTREAEKNGDR